MEFTDEKKQIIREAIRILHDTCAKSNGPSDCHACPFWNNKEMACVFDATPDAWPLSKKTPADWNYFDECEEEEDE